MRCTWWITLSRAYRCGSRCCRCRSVRLLLAEQPELVTPVYQVVQRVVTRRLLVAAGLKANEGHGGAVTLIGALPLRPT